MRYGHSVEKLLSNAIPNTEIFLFFLLIFGVLTVCKVFNGAKLKMLLCTSHRDMLPLMLWQFVAIVKWMNVTCSNTSFVTLCIERVGFLTM